MTLANRLMVFYEKLVEKEQSLHGGNHKMIVMALLSKVDDVIGLIRMSNEGSQLYQLLQKLLLHKSKLLTVMNELEDDGSIDALKDYIKGVIVQFLDANKSYSEYTNDFEKLIAEQKKKSRAKFDWTIRNYEISMSQDLQNKDLTPIKGKTIEESIHNLRTTFLKIGDLSSELMKLEKNVERDLDRSFKSYMENHEICRDDYYDILAFKTFVSEIDAEDLDIETLVKEGLHEGGIFSVFSKQKKIANFKMSLGSVIEKYYETYGESVLKAHDDFYVNLSEGFASRFNQCFEDQYCTSDELNAIIKSLDALMYGFNVEDKSYNIAELIKYN